VGVKVTDPFMEITFYLLAGGVRWQYTLIEILGRLGEKKRNQGMKTGGGKRTACVMFTALRLENEPTFDHTLPRRKKARKKSSGERGKERGKNQLLPKEKSPRGMNQALDLSTEQKWEVEKKKKKSGNNA